MESLTSFFNIVMRISEIKFIFMMYKNKVFPKIKVGPNTKIHVFSLPPYISF